MHLKHGPLRVLTEGSTLRNKYLFPTSGKALMTRPGESKVAVRYTPEFKRNLRILARKHRHIRDDLQAVLKQIQA